MLLCLYRACSAGLAPLAAPILTLRARMLRARLRDEDRARIDERLGRASRARPHGRIAWVHGASSADIAALAPVIDKLGSAGFHVLVTTRSDDEARPSLPPTALHQFAPLDAPSFLARFLTFWRPDIALIAGAEFWPNLILETKRRAIPAVLVNARCPARAVLFGRAAPGFARALFARIDGCFARTGPDAERFRHLGLSCAQDAGDSIYDLAPAPADAAKLARLTARLGARPAWVAFPSNAAEEDMAVEAHRLIVRNFSDLVTIVAVRNARRGQDLAMRAAKSGLDIWPAEEGRRDAPLAAIHVAAAADAGLLYRLAGVAFLGGSLGGARGGVSPIEAARLGCAILHGPEVGDYEDAYAALDAAGGCALVHDAKTLASEVSLLLFDAAEQRAMARAAADAVERRAGASTRIMQAIAPWLARTFAGPEGPEGKES